MKDRIAFGNSVFNFKSCDYDIDDDFDEFNDDNEKNEN